MTTHSIYSTTETSTASPRQSTPAESPLIQSWLEAERAVAARKQAQEAAKVRAEAKVRAHAEAERTRFAHD